MVYFPRIICARAGVNIFLEMLGACVYDAIQKGGPRFEGLPGTVPPLFVAFFRVRLTSFVRSVLTPQGFWGLDGN